MAKTLYKHIVVVHGIGDQQLNETGVDFMNNLCRALPESGRLTVKNLVTRVTDVLQPGKSVPAYVIFGIADGSRYFIGFSEVYWQPATHGYLKQHDEQLPVPIFTWAHSINSRIRGDHRAGQKLSVWREAIENAEMVLNLVTSLARISNKSKQFNQIVRDFLGDVQMYAEVDPIHAEVNTVFRDALDDIEFTRSQIPAEFDSSEIYIVAHSEGTVVSWKSLMLAQSEDPPPDWLSQVQGLVTLGSPIDKHHLIWGKQNFPKDIKKPQERLIRWWNFWDYSDPVGHSLDEIFPAADSARNNQFERVYDAGFARYPIPGLAHVGYWSDVNLHHRIIQEVMQIPAGYEPSQLDTGPRWWGRWWLMQSVDQVSYALGRAVVAAALVYFLSRLLQPVRNGLLQKLPAAGSLLEIARLWPLPPALVPGARWLNLGLWVLGPAAAWKLIWDVGLLEYQDRRLNLESQRRLERVFMMLWSAVLVFAGLNIQVAHLCGQDCTTLKDYVGWAVGLVATILVWNLHTALHKGLLQIWRYGQGDTAFRPSTGETPAAPEETPASTQ